MERTHAQAQYIHAQRRCKQRLNKTYNKTDRKQLIERIRLRVNIIKTVEASNLKTEHILYYKGVLCRVVYDRRTSQIATFLPVYGDGKASK